MMRADANAAVHRPGVIDRLDPRTRLLAAAGAAFAFSAVRQLPAAWPCLAFALALAVVRRPSARVWKRVLAANAFVLFMAVTVPPAVPGETVARLGPVAWTREGLTLALLIAVKSNAILLSFVAFVAGLDPSAIGCALERLRVPAKLVFLFLFTGRYIHAIGEEWSRMQTAAQLRGFAPRTSRHTYRTLAHMFGLTFLNGLDRSRRVYEAMLLRGFQGSFHTVAERRATRADAAFLAVFFAALGALLFLAPRWA